MGAVPDLFEGGLAYLCPGAAWWSSGDAGLPDLKVTGDGIDGDGRVGDSGVTIESASSFTSTSIAKGGMIGSLCAGGAGAGGRPLRSIWLGLRLTEGEEPGECEGEMGETPWRCRPFELDQDSADDKCGSGGGG
jgi:hypothetical protein